MMFPTLCLLAAITFTGVSPKPAHVAPPQPYASSGPGAVTSVVGSIVSAMDILPGGHGGEAAANVGYALNHLGYEQCFSLWRGPNGQPITPTPKMVAVFNAGCILVTSNVLSPEDAAAVLLAIPQHQ